MLRGNKGITIISLVITMIICMILAGVSISYTMGDGSLMKHAREATIASRVKGVQELFQAYISLDYIETQDAFKGLVDSGYLKKVINDNDQSVYYITESGIEKIAKEYKNTTSNDVIYELIPELKTNSEAKITQEIYNELKVRGSVYFVDRALNVAFLGDGKTNGVIYFSKDIDTTIDKWWATEDEAGSDVPVVEEIIDWGQTNPTAENVFELGTDSDINNPGTIIGFKISGYSSYVNFEGDLVIPSYVTVNTNGVPMEVPVTAIEAGAFSKIDSQRPDKAANANITGNIYIPSTVKIIGENAFNGQTNICGGVYIAAETVGESAFKDCKGISKINFAKTTKVIEESAFEGVVNNLRDITFVEGLEEIGASAFKGCNQLGDIVLPSTLTTIGESAFQGCVNMPKTIDLSRCINLKTISEKAFSECNQIKEIIFPNSLLKIEESAFQGCMNCTIQDLRFPENLMDIEANAFNGFYNINGKIYMKQQTEYQANSFRSDYISKIVKE